MEILLFIILAIGISKGLPNTPPHISFERDWNLTEDEPVNSVVARIRVNDAENDDVKISIGDPSYKAFQGRQDGASYFTIDQDNRVILAKPLTGLAGEKFLVGIIASDGNVPNRIDARVIVRRKHDPVNNFIPSSFSASFLPSQITNNLKDLHVDDDDDGFQGPPLLHLDPFTVWVIPSDAEVGTNVTVVEAQNLRDTSLTFSLSPNEVLEIDPQTGRVTTAAPLKDKVGNHSIKVNVSDEVEYITEDVVVRVQPADGFMVPTTSPSSRSPFNIFTSSSSLADLANSSSTQKISDGGSESNIKPDNVIKPTTNNSNIDWIIPLSVVSGVVVLLLLLVGVRCWCRRNKAPGTNKATGASFSEKRDNGGHVTAVRRESIFEDLFSFVGIRRRAQSNGYEDDIKLPNVPNRESRKSSKTSTTYLTVDEKGDDKWEYPRHKIRVLGPLGEGCFGQVWKCEVTDLVVKGTSTVAMKTLKETAGEAEKSDLLQELKVLKSLSFHPNVVALLGCCTEKDPVYVILEHMKEGKLQSYLRSSRAGHTYGNLHGVSSSLTPRDLTIFALQVARGMDFLSKNGIIHRDLAARNILVGEDKICKVADFGFARDLANNNVYQRKSSDGRMPIRWMAPESLFDNIYSTKGDVWSFGILLWEIVTLGSTPYPGMAAAEVMRRVKNGFRLEKPDHCRREIYNIMYYCWDFEEKERPSFPELVKSLEALIMSEVDYIQLEKFPEHSYYNFSSVSTSAELL